MTLQKNDPRNGENSILAEDSFPLLRRFSIASLVAMLVTAAILIWLYRQDQLTEHGNIAARQNEQTAVHFMQLLGGQIDTLVSTSNGLDSRALQANPSIGLLSSAQKIVREHDILKLSIYNMSGAIIYSSAREEIGGNSLHPDFLEKALSGEATYRHEFRNTFHSATGEMHDVYVDLNYLPLNYAGKRIGAIEIYRDSTPVFVHLNTNTTRIPLIVLGIFSLLYAALFFYIRKADRGIAEWQKLIHDTALTSESQQRLSSFVANVPGFVFSFRMSPEGCFSFPFVSPGINEIYGLHPEDVRDDMAALHGLAHPEDAPRIEDIIAESARTMSAIQMELRVLRPGYAERWVECRSTPEREADGGIIWHGIMLDITERKQAEIELYRRTEKFRALVENSPDPIVRYGRDGRRLYVNPALERLGGKPGESLLGVTPDEVPLVPDKEQGKLSGSIRQVLETGQLVECDMEFVAPDGRVYVFHSRYIPEFGQDGAVANVMSISTDITERKRMEQAIAAREQEFRSLAENSPDSIIRYDRDGRIRYLNTGLLGYLGLNATDVIGRLPREVWPDGRYAEIERAIARAMATGEASIVELHGADAAGQLIFSQIYVVPERDVTGQIIGTIAIGRDVSDIREAERKLKHFVDNLPGLAYTFRLSPDGHASIPYASSVIEEFYGLKPEDVKDDIALYHMLMHPDDRPRIEATIAESARTMMPFHAEFRVCRPGKPVRWLEARSMPERDADGSIIWYGIMLDTTERKRAEEALAKSERELRALTESTPGMMGSFYLRPDGSICMPYASAQIGELFGLAPQDVAADATPLMARTHPDDAQMVQDSIAKSAHTLTTWHQEYRILHPGKGERWIESNTNPEAHPDGGVIWYGYVHDITERKLAERQLRDLTAYLQTVREEEKASLAREIHDDLGGTLFALKMQMYLLDCELSANIKDTPPSAHIKPITQMIDGAIASVRSIITDLRPAILDHLGLPAAIKWQAEQFHKRTGIEYLFDCIYQEEKRCKDCEDCERKFDEVSSINLFRILQEALTNVARHSGASRVSLEFQPGKDEISLSITDNGRGLPEGHTIASTSHGMRGMRERVIQLGGIIEFSSPQDGGFSVKVKLPLPGNKMEETLAV